ncbi:MAG: hypothetical protein HY047_19900 [Acidobacteria bacterium]|nr:hypothetical protein [Acidobacteriota bacterium]
MRDRLLAFVGSLAVAAAAVALTPDPLAAQTQKPAANRPAAPVPRTADGHPDFTGFYDVATMTPVERPNGVALVLSDKEAAAMEQYEAQRQVKNDAPIAGDRPAPPVGGETTTGKSYLEFLERAGGGVVGGYNNFWLAGGTKMITVDGQKRSSLIVDPPDGKVPPMKPEARRRNQAFLASAVSPDASESAAAGPSGAFDDPERRPLAERCLLGFGSTSGPPTLPNYFYNNMKQIVQTKDHIMILNEMVHDARIIRMNAEHLPQDIRRWMGDSVGHWEGDTLVVDTTNFTSKTQFRGSSENLHVVERFSWMDGNLRYRFTVEDPSTWDRAWTGEYPWVASKDYVYEYACHEGNYAIVDMLRGARAKDAEDAAKKP